MMRGILRSRMPSNGTEHVPDLSHFNISNAQKIFLFTEKNILCYNVH